MEYIVHVDKAESRVPNMVIGGVEGFSVLTMTQHESAVADVHYGMSPVYCVSTYVHKVDDRSHIFFALYNVHYMYSTRQKKVANTVYRFTVFSSVFRVVPFYRFTVPFTVLPFTVYRSIHRFTVPFCRFTVLPFQV